MSNFEVSDLIFNSPFESGTHNQIAVKVIDDRGNELMVVKSLKDMK